MTGAAHRIACAGEPDGLPVESAAGFTCGRFGYGKGTTSTLIVVPCTKWPHGT